jgi:hypothetical protein
MTIKHLDNSWGCILKSSYSKKNTVLSVILALTSSMVLFQNCSKSQFTQALSSDPTKPTVGPQGEPLCAADRILVADKCEPVVCDAFSAKDSTNACVVKNGLVGNLHYMNLTYDQNGRVTNRPANSDNVEFYMNNAVKSPEIIFMSTLNIPTVSFTKGFGIDGRYLKNTQGTKITEYFALNLYSSLKAINSNEAGEYHLVILSDDGSVLDIAKNQVFEVGKHPSVYSYEQLINNDGVHAVKAGCAKSSIFVSEKEALPIRLKYFQGPREHISLSLFWKKVDAGSGQKSTDYCGSGGVEPQDLVRNGFQLIPQANYIAPQVF